MNAFQMLRRAAFLKRLGVKDVNLTQEATDDQKAEADKQGARKPAKASST